MSAKGFYESQPVTEFVCETLGVRNLEDRKIQIDKEKLKKAISGNYSDSPFLPFLRSETVLSGTCFAINSNFV